ncbi:helix-turn-helix domain-containing protein [Micromonospora coxensis]|uniref:Transcriptional regulatory protein, C terminal n=1 Tax=Micromonospora coxensis TaxID=356852 RepID=A0A1C5HDK7_9ACTN|nr:helix-turn-helix domain-containing protein [Micromonospora coxensis]SCG44074.1 Transcriptional regulatory protein, C terminal [Micromonospora coxensis]
MFNRSIHDVEIIRWPEESARRELCRNSGRLRLLIVATGTTPPMCTDPREDWVRVPAPREDLSLRARALLARAGSHQIPQVNMDGVLTFRSQSVALSRGEAAVMEVLIRNFGLLVAREALCDELAGGDQLSSRNSLDLHIMRLRRRITPLGLVIRTAWGRGYIVESADPESGTN